MSYEKRVRKVLSHYPLPGEMTEITPIKTGLIHSSYKISEVQGASYLLQKINTSVFQHVNALMQNIAFVTGILNETYKNTSYESLELLKTSNGQFFYKDESSAWRIYHFKEHLNGYDVPEDEVMVKEAGKAFAAFSKALSKTDPGQLSIPIPDFHSLEKRHEQLKQALKNTRIDLSGIHHLSDQIEEFTQLLLPLEQARKSGKIPIRITHNDSKFNNLLFDNAGKARCVVDLDTVMPGIIHFDVGDCLRTLVPSTPEDEADLGNITLRKHFYSAFLDGYIDDSSGWLTKEEIRFIPYAAPYMALIMGTRFLTDYLQGNIYYSCNYPKHNLVRAKCQVEVTRQFLEQFPLNN